MKIKEIILNKKIELTDRNKEDFELFKKEFKNKPLDAWFWKKDKVEWDEWEDGFSNIIRKIGLRYTNILIFFKDKVIRILGNISFRIKKNYSELYIINFSIHKSFGKNGVKKTIEYGDANAENFSKEIIKIGTNKNYIIELKDNTDILKAIKLYKEIDDLKQKNESEDILLSNFKRKVVYKVDIKNIDRKRYNIIKCKNDNYIEEYEINRIASDSYKGPYLLLESIPLKIKSIIKKTLMHALKNKGGLQYSDDLNKRRNKLSEKSLNLIDFKLAHIDKNKSRLFLVLNEDENNIPEEGWINIFDRLSFIKSQTMLSVVKDIERQSIGNMNLFNYLFNNGDFSKIGNLNWEINYNLRTKYLKTLNDKQKEAFNLSTDKFPVTFIQGPPGTGKTYLITQLCKYYADLKKRVLVSSQTNVAVENILDNLDNDYSFQNIFVKAEKGDKSKYAFANIHKIIEKRFEKIFDFENVDLSYISMGEFISKSMIIGSTTTSSALKDRMWNDFEKNIDVLIIDEISKSSVPELIRYVVNAKKIIFVGDQRQLAPLDEIDRDDDVWDSFTEEDQLIIDKFISISIFDKLFKDMKKNKRAIMLTENRRSIKSVLEIYSLFYNNKLTHYREDESSKIKWNITPMNPFTFLSMNNSKEIKDGTSRKNILEAEYINTLLNDLVKNIENTSELTVAIIATYGAQVKTIKNVVEINKFKNKYFKNVKVNTVDAFQGDQADIVIISTVLADKSNNPGFIRDYRRLNVAISRAKDLVIVLGNDNILKNISMDYDGEKRNFFEEIFEKLKANDNVNYQSAMQRKDTSK